MENETKTTKKMTIARALKEKERIARRLRRARTMLADTNVVPAGVERVEDAGAVFASVQKFQDQYLQIKKAIATANAGISAQLTEMLVVRAEKEYYESLHCREVSSENEVEITAEGSRIHRPSYRRFDAFIDENRRREIVEALEQRLDDLQDEVDAFNATHTLELAV